MLKFNCSIFALILSPFLLSAQTPKPAAGGTVANPSRGGVITGRVTDSQEQPVAGERMRVNRLGRNGEARPVYVGTNPDMYTTDDRGVYRIFGLPPGRYLVSAGYLAQEGQFNFPTPRFFYPQTFHPNVTDKARAKIIEVTEGSESTGVDIVLAERKRSYDIYGRVVNDDTGEPVAGVALSYGVASVEGKSVASHGESSEPSESTGRFRLTNVAPGRYAVFVHTAAANDFLSEPTICEVGDNDLYGVVIRVRQGGAISGVALVEGTNDPSALAGLKQIRIYCNNSAPGQWNLPRGPDGSNVNPDGSFHLRAIQPGKVWLRVTQFFEARGLTLSRIEWNGAPHRGGFDVAAGEQITGVRLIFAYGSLTLRGQLKIAGGSAPAAMRWYVLANRPDQPPQDLQLRAEVDAQGEFTLEHLSPGDYELSLLPSKVEGLDLQMMNALISFKERIVVTGNNPPITLQFDLGRKENEK